MKQKEQNKILKNIFIFIGVIIIGFVLFFLVFYYINNFEYKGVKFEINKNEIRGVTLYRTSVPVINNGKEVDYNFYLRDDPRTIEQIVPLEGNIIFRKNMVLEVTTDNLFCGGDWNYFQLQLSNIAIFDISLIVKNDSINYQPARDYMFMTINEGNKTEIIATSGNAYEINVANCEIASAADRLLLEAIIKNNEIYTNK